MKLLYWIRRSKIDSSISVIYAKLTYQGHSVVWTTKLEIPTNQFSEGKASPRFREINKKLLAIKDQIYDLDLKVSEKYQGRDRLKMIQKLVQTPQPYQPIKTVQYLLDLCKAQKLGKREIANGTRKNIQCRFLLCQEYINENGLGNNLIPDFTVYKARELYNWLERKGYSHNYALKVLFTFKEAMKIGVELGEINFNPFDKLNLKEKTKPPVYLEQVQLDTLEELELSGDLEQCKDIFLLACYTGFSTSDLKKDLTRLIKTDGEFKYIELVRKKSRKDEPLTAYVPFNDKIAEILQKYGNGKIKFSDVVVNRRLKPIGRILGIKGLSLKMGRNTFCDQMISKGFSLDVVATMMGHKSTRTTLKFYGKVRLNRIILEHQKILSAG